MKNTLRILISALLVLAMALSFASCTPSAEEFYIDGSAYVNMQVGEVVALELVKPDSLKGKVEWISDNEDVVIVANGTLVAQGEGTTLVHAILGDYSDKVIVTVGTPKPGTGNNSGNTNTGNNNTGNNNTGNNNTGTNGGTNTGTNGGTTDGGNTNTGNGGSDNNGGSTTAGLIGSLDFSSTAQRTSLSTSEQVWANGNVTLTNTVGDNPVADYSNPARFYPNSSIIIDCQGMKKIVMNCDNQYKDSTGAIQSAAQAAGASVVVDGETLTITLPSTMDSFTMKLPSQARLKSLEVYGR